MFFKIIFLVILLVIKVFATVRNSYSFSKGTTQIVSLPTQRPNNSASDHVSQSNWPHPSGNTVAKTSMSTSQPTKDINIQVTTSNYSEEIRSRRSGYQPNMRQLPKPPIGGEMIPPRNLIISNSDSEYGKSRNCGRQKQNCEGNWEEPKPWSECKFPIFPDKTPLCYRTSQWRTTACKKKKVSCQMFEWRLCLHNETCFGQWSSWSPYSGNCSIGCKSGFKSRIRYCYKDGEVASGVCIGGGININNQTERRNCTLRECIESRNAVNPTSPTSSSTFPWGYMFYVTVAGVSIIGLFLIAVGGYAIYRRKSNQEIARATGSTTTSNSFVISAAIRQEDDTPAYVTSFTPQTNPLNSNMFNTNVYQSMEIPGTSALTHEPRSSRRAFVKLRKLPSLPRSKAASCKPPPPPRINSKYSSVFDKVGKTTTIPQNLNEKNKTGEGQNEDIHAEGPYTRMKSFNSSINSTAYQRSQSTSNTLTERRYRRSVRNNGRLVKHRGASEFHHVSSHWSETRGSLRKSSATAARVHKRKSSRIQQRNKVLHNRNQIYYSHNLSSYGTKKSEEARQMQSNEIYIPSNKIVHAGTSTIRSSLTDCSATEVDDNNYLVPLPFHKVQGESLSTQVEHCDDMEYEDICYAEEEESSYNEVKFDDYVTISIPYAQDK